MAGQAAGALDPDCIALIGLGEAGAAIARGLAEQSGWVGARGANARRLIGVDTALDDGGPKGAAIGAHARQYGVALAGAYTPALAEAEMAFCQVPGVDAKAAAAAAVQVLKPGTVYLDISTLTGQEAREIAAIVTARGLDYVDAAAVGGFASQGYKARLLLAGPGAARAAAWMAPLGFETEVVSDRAGDASAIKIVRSIMMKGMEALSVECLTLAWRQGILDEVIACMRDVEEHGFRNFIQMLLVTHMAHAKRRMEEMDKAMQNLRESGMEPLMTAATFASHKRTVEAGATTADGSKPSLEDALKILSERVVTPAVTPGEKTA